MQEFSKNYLLSNTFLRKKIFANLEKKQYLCSRFVLNWES